MGAPRRLPAARGVYPLALSMMAGHACTILGTPYIGAHPDPLVGGQLPDDREELVMHKYLAALLSAALALTPLSVMAGAAPPAAMQTDAGNRLLNPTLAFGVPQTVNAGDFDWFAPTFWNAFNGDTSTVALSVVGDAPPGFDHSVKFTVTAAATAATGNAWQLINYFYSPVIASTFGTSAARALSLSVGIKASIAGTYGIYVADGQGSRGLITPCTVAANVWTDCKVSGIAGDTGGSNWGQAAGLAQFVVNLATGSASNVTANSWTAMPASGALGLSNQAQLTQTLNATFQIAYAKLEESPVVTPFVQPDQPTLARIANSEIDCTYFLDLPTCVNNLPFSANSSAGAVLRLAANTVWTVGAQLTVDNGSRRVLVKCDPGAKILRGAGYNGQLVSLNSAGSAIEDCTIDDNGVVNTAVNVGFSTVGLSGDYTAARRLTIVNGRAIGIAIGGNHVRVEDNNLTGVADATAGNMGIWSGAVTTADTTIRGNFITGFGSNGIFVDNSDVAIDHNYLVNNHCMTSIGGGQIDVSGNSRRVTLSDNIIDPGCGALSSGIELSGADLSLSHNLVVGQKFNGIVLQSSSNTVLHGDIIKNSATANSAPAILVTPGTSNFQIIGERAYDDKVTKTQTYGLLINAGASDNYIVTGNLFVGNLTGGISDGGTGIHKVVTNNLP